MGYLGAAGGTLSTGYPWLFRRSSSPAGMVVGMSLSWGLLCYHYDDVGSRVRPFLH